jgi:hypothetical protein
MSVLRDDDNGGDSAVSFTSATISAQDIPFWGAGITVRRLGRMMDELPGGRRCLAGLTIGDCWRGNELCPFAKVNKQPLCDRLQAEGDAGVGIATWYLAWSYNDNFLDFLEAVEYFFAGEPQGLDTVVWFGYASKNIWTTEDPSTLTVPQKVKRVVQGMRNLVMFMSTWGNSLTFARAWCLWELFCCRSCGGRVEFVLPRAQREQLHDTMRSRPASFLESLPTVRSESSTCFYVSSQENVFAAISAEVGFSGLDASVRSAVEEWFQRLLRGMIGKACFGDREEGAEDEII